MPILSIPRNARDLAIKAAKDERDNPGRSYCTGYHNGVMDALRVLLPSEVVGCIVMDRDCALEGEPLYTETLPRLVLAEMEKP